MKRGQTVNHGKKKVTLIFPPTFDVNEKEKKELVSELKSKAYNLWISCIEKKFGPASDLYKVFPSNAHPISLGLLSLSTYLKKRGIEVTYIHCDYWLNGRGMTWDELLKFVAEETKGSDVCGLTSTTPAIDCALQIARAVKLKNPKAIVVIGGPHVTFTDIETINRHPFIDLVVRGEGEETLFEIVKNSDQPAKLKGILGTTYRDCGVTKRAAIRPLLSATEIPAPDFAILPKDYNPLLINIGSRGCPFKCKFCVEHKIWEDKVRFRDPKVVAEELMQIRRRYNQNLIHLADSEIDASPYHLKELLDAIDHQKIDCRITVNFRPDAYKRISPALLERMSDLGFVGYFIGVESGSDYMLEKMDRKSIYSDFEKTVNLLNQGSTKIIIPYLMMGFPGETEDTLKETEDKFIKLLEEDRISFLFPKIFVPYPGTDPYQQPEAYSIKISKDWKKYTRFDFPPPFSSTCLSNDELSVATIRFYERIYSVMEKKSGQSEINP